MGSKVNAKYNNKVYIYKYKSKCKVYIYKYNVILNKTVTKLFGILTKCFFHI